MYALGTRTSLTIIQHVIIYVKKLKKIIIYLMLHLNLNKLTEDDIKLARLC